jgi:hypothetical protein
VDAVGVGLALAEAVAVGVAEDADAGLLPPPSVKNSVVPRPARATHATAMMDASRQRLARSARRASCRWYRCRASLRWRSFFPATPVSSLSPVATA